MPNKQIQSLTVEGVTYDIVDNTSGYINAQYIENKTDYSIPVSRAGEIIAGETAIGTDSTNFPTSKAVVDYVDERVVQEIEAIDVGVTGIKANGTSLSVVDGVVNIPAIGPNQSVGLMTDQWMQQIWNRLHSIPTSTSQLTNDSGFITASDIPTTDLSGYMQKRVDYVTAGQKSGTTLGTRATAEGYDNTASGVRSHAEGSNNTSSGSYSHAEGYYTTASGDYSHVEGRYTIAQSVSQHVFGQYNIADTQGSNQVKGTYVEIVGNGSATYERSNARTLDWNGNEILAGKLTVGAGPTANMDVATKQYVDNSIPTVPTNISSFTNDSGYLTASDIASVMTYKGTKANYAALPSTGNTTGDVWHLTDTGAEWAWDGSAWQELGTAIDLSGYATKATTLAGYGITDAKIQNGTITLGGNTITPLTSYTETDPVFSASAAAGITSTDISNWNAKVSDDKTWNGITLDTTGTTQTSTSYIPARSSTNATTAYQLIATTEPYRYRVAKWDNSAYLYSTTPSANDNSTKVATTAYVDAAIPNTSGFVSKSGDTINGRLILGDTAVSGEQGLVINYRNISGALLTASGVDGSGSTSKIRLKFETINTTNGIILNGIETPTATNSDYDKYAANKKYVDDSIPKVYSSTNTGGYLTMATLPIYDGTVV